MKALYLIIAGINDQNALAQLFFKAGYYLWLMVEMSERKNESGLGEGICGFHNTIAQICQYSQDSTPAKAFCSCIRAKWDEIMQITGGNNPSERQCKGFFNVCTSLINIDEYRPRDVARCWLLVGVNSSALDIELDRTGDKIAELKSIMLTFLQNAIGDANKYAGREVWDYISMPGINLDESSFGQINAWLAANAKTIWQPAKSSAEKHCFNGKELTLTEYTALATLRQYAYGASATGLSYEKLEEKSGMPSAKNCIKNLRTYPETKNFISAKSPLKFIGNVPAPPESTSC